ncbi:MAG: insulinase family protein [Candidatus Omnitrophica bacterium]|nr:insulinase family protein [Candidatus Omnitrophota bacterium]
MTGPAMEPPSVPSSLKSVERPHVVRKVLSNGLTVLAQRDASHALVAFHAVVRTGSSTEGEYLGTGISHVVEHMLFKGTARRPVGAVEKEARSYGGSAQGMTNYDTTSYPLTVNKEKWSEAADLLVDALFFPSMDAEEFRKERDVVLRELKLREDDPEQIAWELLFSNAYRVHTYRIPIIGYEPLLTKLTAEDVRTYHRIRYTPNSTVIAVVGDVDPEAAVRRIEELAGRIPPGKVTADPMPEEPPQLSPREVTQEADAGLAIYSTGYPGVPINHPDLYALDLLSWVLGGGRGSVLEKALKETGVVHSVSCWNYTPRDRGLFNVTLRADPERVPEAERRLEEELARFKETPLPAAELAAAKRAFLKDYLVGRQTVGGQAADLAGFEVLTGDPLFAYRYLEEVERIQPGDLQRTARAYLVPGRRTAVRIFPRGTSSAHPASAPAGSPQAKESAPQEKAAPRTEKVVLDNGLRVLLRADHRLPLLTLQLSMLGGVRYETEQNNGISGIASRMLTRGTRRRSAEQITEELKRLGAHASPFSGRNSLGIALETVSAESEAAVRLLGEMVLQPAFHPEEVEKQRRLGMAALKTQEEDPFSWGIRRLAATLFTTHPYRLDPSGTQESLSKLQPEDLAHFHRIVLRPESMVLSVVGDFKREEILPLLKDVFGRFQAEPGLNPPVVPAEPPLARLRERMETAPRQEGILLIGFPGLSVADPRLPPLDLVETVLSGGAGRLFAEVRERRGLAYTVGGFSMPGVEPGAFVLYAVTDPSHLDQVRKAMLAEVQRVCAGPVPAEEMTEAKEGLLGQRRIARQTQAAQASQIAGDELFGLGFDHAEKYEARVRSLTAEEVRRTAQEILDPQRCVVVTGRPNAPDSKEQTPVQAATER